MTIVSKEDMIAREAFITPESREQQRAIHECIGWYMACWANCESNLIGILARLLSTSAENTDIIYAGLRSVQSRRLTIRALAKQNLGDEDFKKVAGVLKRFATETSIRNALAHSEYMLDLRTGAYLATAHWDLESVESKGSTVTSKPLDHARISEIEDSARRLASINDELRALRTVPLLTAGSR